MSFYRSGDDDATDEVVAQVFAPVEEPVVVEHRVVRPPAWMVAVAVADLTVTGHGRGGGAVLAVGGSRPVRGEAVVFCHPVVTAPVVIRRDGRVQAQGWLPDQVRLGILEPHLGSGVIERLVGDPGLGT